MADPTEPPALAHIEKTLADSYRREMDQEENTWRSLPFFAATLALQLTALFQVIERLPDPAAWAGLPARALVLASFGCSLGALCLLAASIRRAKFRYIAGDNDLLTYASGLMEEERAQGSPAPGQVPALHALRLSLATQYATATDHNRRINRARERRRSDAGLLTIFSVISTLVLVALTVAAYIPRHIP